MAASADRHALAARDVGVRKPLSPGWHAELHTPFELHAVYREHSDGTRQTYGSLSVEAVEAWQRAAKRRTRSRSTIPGRGDDRGTRGEGR